MSERTLRGCQREVDEWINTIGVRYFSELTNTAVLMEEVGELARLMARTYGEQSFKEGEEADLGMEVADVLFVLVCLANQTGVDLEEAFERARATCPGIAVVVDEDVRERAFDALEAL